MNKELKKFMRAHFILIFTGSFLNIFALFAITEESIILAILTLIAGIVNIYCVIMQLIASKRIGWSKDGN